MNTNIENNINKNSAGNASNSADVLIIGGGTAGLTAAIYVQRAGKQAIIFEKTAVGGQIINAQKIENFPGMPGTSGVDFAIKLYRQAMDLGTKVVYAQIDKIKSDGKNVTIFSEDKNEKWQGKSLIIATGASHRKMKVDGEEELIGHGISMCAACDGNFYKGKEVAVYGGGNTALQDAIYLSNIAKKVYVIHRRNEFRAEQILQKQIKKIENIEIILDVTIQKVQKLNDRIGLTLVNKGNKGNKSSKIKEVDGLFLAIGMEPNTEKFSELLDLDKNGYIIANEDTKTKISNVFVAGDCRTKYVRQLTTATADGTIAAINACKIK